MLDEAVKAAERWHAKTGEKPLESGMPRTILTDAGLVSDAVKNMKKASKHAEERASLGSRPDPRWLIIHLMLEECAEKVAGIALGDPIEALDGILDCIYVDVRAALLFGMDVDGGYTEVVRSNDSKQFSGNLRIKDKGPNYSPPNLLPFLGKSSRD